MALERFLVELIQSDYFTPEIIDNIVTSILSRSNSVMPTAVIASLTLGFHERFLLSALPLLRVKEFFFLDFHRSHQESRPPRLNLFGRGPLGSRDPARDVYRAERQTAYEYPWRQHSLRELPGLLQFTSCRDEVLSILEKHNSELTGSDDESTWKNWLYQMDLRNAEIKKDRQKKGIVIQPTPSPEVELTPEDKENIAYIDYTNRLIALKNWLHEALKKKIDFPDDYFSAKDIYVALERFQKTFNDHPQKYFIFQDVLAIGCAVLLKNYRSDLYENSEVWCIQTLCRILSQDACRRNNAQNEIDHSGSIEVTKILPSLFNLQNSKELCELQGILSHLLACPNDNMRKAAGQAIRGYMWRLMRNSRRCV